MSSIDEFVTNNRFHPKPCIEKNKTMMSKLYDDTLVGNVKKY